MKSSPVTQSLLPEHWSYSILSSILPFFFIFPSFVLNVAANLLPLTLPASIFLTLWFCSCYNFSKTFSSTCKHSLHSGRRIVGIHALFLLFKMPCYIWHASTSVLTSDILFMGTWCSLNYFGKEVESLLPGIWLLENSLLPTRL